MAAAFSAVKASAVRDDLQAILDDPSASKKDKRRAKQGLEMVDSAAASPLLAKLLELALSFLMEWLANRKRQAS